MKKGLEDLKENFREQVEFWVVLKDWEAFRSHKEGKTVLWAEEHASAEARRSEVFREFLRNC